MSVLACCRYGCEGIMCDRYSNTYGYICNDCYDQLEASGAGVDIQVFMDTEPELATEKDTLLNYDEEFPIR